MQSHSTGRRVAVLEVFGAREGLAALELALLAPVVLILLMGMFDVGQLAFTMMQVNSAANAGAQYVYANGCSSPSAIAAAVTGASTDGAIQASPAPACGVAECVVNDALVAPTQGSCASGDLPGEYATISAKASFSPVAPWSGLVMPTTLVSATTIRYGTSSGSD